MLDELVERFEQTFPLSAMARALLEAAISPQWVDEVFELNRERQYPKELMFSSIVSVMMMVTPEGARFGERGGQAGAAGGVHAGAV